MAGFKDHTSTSFSYQTGNKDSVREKISTVLWMTCPEISCLSDESFIIFKKIYL